MACPSSAARVHRHAPISRRLPTIFGCVALLSVGMVCSTPIGILGNGKPTPSLAEQIPLRELGTPAPVSDDRITPENANQLALLTRWGESASNTPAWSPDGRTLAVPTPYGVHVFESETLRQISVIRQPSWVTSVTYCPDGSLLASAGFDGTLRISRVSDGSLVRELQDAAFAKPVFSPDGTLLATASAKKPIRLWHVTDWTLAREFTLTLAKGCT